ncbi:Alpha/Beta hydrolase protein [Microdochium trichocladiopsis]|uniref:Alpha/Beta hydrolase protein n=1 Tax=Microdochium trichocladiopsis TaxID=1682393 RepID=A0A9P9BTX1_9PEZI|nr:Alpha/Beta hydrolase protein [Microdochium trichocladiopsis]KAH7036014.1 Alpha/Beta hydrolase protein [Microdochium trichocladiopsis]
MADRFSAIPSKAVGKPVPFTLSVPEEALNEFQILLKLSKIGPSTWWNQPGDGQFGLSREWLTRAQETWLAKFDWRDHEKRINAIPNFKIPLQDPELGQLDIHFAALFSKKPDAVPLMFLHGFPSSFMDFLPIMETLVGKYTPETLPYHVIAPSLPDYGLSVRTTRKAEMTVHRAARVMHQLMLDLGFGESGYVVQGGDLGSMLARTMAVEYEECKAFHVNMLVLNPGDSVSPSARPTAEEQEALDRTKRWQETGFAYALEHGTRPATVGLAMSSNPLALLAWIGEKLCEWVDPHSPLSLDTILATVSFYWFTDTFPNCLYHAELVKKVMAGSTLPISTEKPMGYSLFAHDLAILPRAWAEELYPNLKLFRFHAEGGHFASLEQPQSFLADVEEFIQLSRSLFSAPGALV